MKLLFNLARCLFRVPLIQCIVLLCGNTVLFAGTDQRQFSADVHWRVGSITSEHTERAAAIQYRVEKVFRGFQFAREKLREGAPNDSPMFWQSIVYAKREYLKFLLKQAAVKKIMGRARVAKVLTEVTASEKSNEVHFKRGEVILGFRQ